MARLIKEVGRNYNTVILPEQLTIVAWASVTGTPTTVAGYGITDAITAAAATTGGQVAFFNGASVITSVSGLYFDGVNKLGIANASPSYNLDVTGTARITSDLIVDTDTLCVDATSNTVSIGTTSNPDSYTLNVNGNGKFVTGVDIAHTIGFATINLGATSKTPTISGYRIDANNSELYISTYDGGTQKQITIRQDGDLELPNTILTGPPTGGTAQPWKLGQYNATAPTATGYIEVEVNGTLYKLLAAT